MDLLVGDVLYPGRIYKFQPSIHAPPPGLPPQDRIEDVLEKLIEPFDHVPESLDVMDYWGQICSHESRARPTASSRNSVVSLITLPPKNAGNWRPFCEWPLKVPIGQRGRLKTPSFLCGTG